MRIFVMMFALVAAANAVACDGFVVGKKVSATGRVIVSHNEDNIPKHTMRYAMIPAGAPLFDEPGHVKIPQVERTYACHWSELKSADGKPYPGDLFLNENGVAIYSNNGGVYEEWDGVKFALPDEGYWSSCTDGGLGINLRFAVAQRARTAAEGVSIMTNLVTTYGYEPLSRTFTIADKNEAWLVQVLHGRRFVARRCPDDAVVAYPNCLTIGRIEPGDICSPHIEAQRGTLNFAAKYQGPRTWKSPFNFHRGLDLYRIVAGVDVLDAKEYPFSIKPAHKISVDDIKRGLSSHYEGMPYEVNPKHPAKGPKVLEPICRLGTLESMVCAFGDTSAEDVIHLAMGRPCETPYRTYRPFGDALPGDIVTGAEALKRIAEHYRVERCDDAVRCSTDAPIGVFDSGLGGLTVLERLLDVDQIDNASGRYGPDGVPDLAREAFVYLGDQANMPYGDYAAEGKSDYLRELILKDAKFLLATNYYRSAEERVPSGSKPRAKIIVIACNTATAWGLADIRRYLASVGDDTKVVGVIEAGVRATLDQIGAKPDSAPFAVGVMATPGTIASGAYARTIRAELEARGVTAEIPVISQGCAGLADAVEAGSPTANAIASSNLVALVRQHRDSGFTVPIKAVILGCTHYPFVLDALNRTVAELRAKGAPLADDFRFVDPAFYTAAECHRLLREAGRLTTVAQREKSMAFLSVANPELPKDRLTSDGQLTRAFKYGRNVGSDAVTTKPVPFTRARFGDAVFQNIGRLLPCTAALLER